MLPRGRAVFRLCLPRGRTDPGSRVCSVVEQAFFEIGETMLFADADNFTARRSPAPSAVCGFGAFTMYLHRQITSSRICLPATLAQNRSGPLLDITDLGTQWNSLAVV